jgi:subtilisin family serine protease
MARAHVSARIGALGLCAALASPSARAQVPFERLREFVRARPGGLGAGSLRAAPGTPPYGSAGTAPYASGGAHWVPVARGRGLWRVADATLAAGDVPGVLWAPPLHLLMDRARASLALDGARQHQGAGSGQGVVIGIVDAGIDAAHPDLRNADGTTRIAWWIDFASNPAGLHPELEAEFGCAPQSGLRCQVLSGADLDQRLNNSVRGDEPGDPLGHGTHVASIAAGNGRAREDGAYAGIAPEATLIVARVTGESGIREDDVVLASKFVFDRAAELGLPAVVNLSLGSDFGAHDGSSQLAQLLSALVGPDQPGRAIVVAAGNSGQLLSGVTNDPAAEPAGIHTEVEVTPQAPVRVPLLTARPLDGRMQTSASVFLWLNLFPASELSVLLELPDGTRSEPVSAGQLQTVTSAGVTAAIIHGLADAGVQAELEPSLPGLELGQLLPSPDAAVILIDGSWRAGSSFSIELAGRGRAELWAQAEGDLAPEANPIGAVFAHASAQQTVTIPASDPGLIAVGASINRLDWLDYRGQPARYQDARLEPAPALGAAAFFSSAGPNRLGDIKPDLLAPGGFVIAALASAADPRSGGQGVFSGLCSPLGCQVVSSAYAVTAGTSMAAPMVSGAIALLLQRSPRLSQPELRALLQAGSDALDPAPEPGSREGGGVLNIARSFQALASSPVADAAQPDAAQSRLRFAGGFLLADPARELSAQLWLRDAAGQVFDADPARLSARVTGGVLARELERLAPGLYRLSLTSPSPALAETLRVQLRIDGRSWLEGELPVLGAVERRGDSLAGGCSASAVGLQAGYAHGAAGLALLVLLLGARGRAPHRRRLRSSPEPR